MRLRWSSDNPLARAVARVPLPIRAKQLFGSLAVAALLALVAVLGLVALGQSNSRGKELKRLQQQGGYEQLLVTDATQLKQLIDLRLERPGELDDRPTRSDEPDLRHFDPDSYQRGFLSALDQQIGNEFAQLCLDAGIAPQTFVGAPSGCPVLGCTGQGCAPPRCHTFLAAVVGVRNGPCVPLPHLPLTLRSVAPSLSRLIADQPRLFIDVGGASGTPQAPFQSEFIESDRFVGSVRSKLAALTANTQARADELVATDRRSFTHSRNLLIGAGAGSLLLALALGLLLSDSLLVPLRKTQSRLAAIAAGDFSGRVVVPNRDEIGALAADVNRMNDELQRLYQELETASRHKSDFLATMSHELRTPLNAIIGFSEVLHQQISGELNEDQQAEVEDVLVASEHLHSLINDVLDLAKVEAGKMELELSELAIPEVLRSAVSLHSERANRRGVEVALMTGPEEITISADERRVRQVVFNLLSNAIKFTPDGGRIDVCARADDGHVEIAVADTGPGIRPEDLEKIFEEFEQASDGRKAEGTGLGLPLSRKLVELHGGRLWVESEPGQGSTFRFTLPVEHKA